MKTQTQYVFLLFLLFVCCTIGCRSVTITTADAMVGNPQTYTAHIFLWGLIGDNINTGSSGIVRVEAIDTIGDKIIGIITCGLYAPRTVSIWSKQHVETSK